MLEGDRAALRDIRRQVDSLRNREEEAAPRGTTAGSAAAPLPLPASQLPPPSSHLQPPPVGVASEDEPGMRRWAKSGATSVAATATASNDFPDNSNADAPANRGADVVSALRFPRFVAASGSLPVPGPSEGFVDARAPMPHPHPPATPFVSSDPPAFASSAQARAEVERLRRERRALLVGQGGSGGGADAGQAYTASHPLVRHVDRLTVLADRQAASLQAQGL